MASSSGSRNTSDYRSTSENDPTAYLLPQSIALLEEARRDTAKRPLNKAYASDDFRQTIIEASKRKLGFAPRGWQLDTAEALYLGLDTVAVAGTGSGKTLAFGLIHLVLPGRVTVVFSPLNALQTDHVCTVMPEHMVETHALRV